MFGSLKPSDRSSELRSFGLSEADHSGSCPVHVLCSNDSYASKQVKRSPFSAWKCLRRRSAAFTAASHAEGHWFDPRRDHPPSICAAGGLLWVGWQAATLSRSCHINSRDTSASRGDITIRFAQVRLGCPNMATYRETARF